MDIQIVDLPEQQTAVMREQVAMNALPEFFGRAFAAVSAAIEAQGLQPAGPPFALYHGMPANTVDAEAGSRCRQPSRPGMGFGLASCRRAAPSRPCTSAPTTPWAYDAVKQRMHEEGLKASDDMWEYYLSDPPTDAATWRTLVVWPVL